MALSYDPVSSCWAYAFSCMMLCFITDSRLGYLNLKSMQAVHTLYYACMNAYHILSVEPPSFNDEN
jgi:hypothetical protein